MGRISHRPGPLPVGIELLEGRSLPSVMLWDRGPGFDRNEVRGSAAVNQRDHESGAGRNPTGVAGGIESADASGGDPRGNLNVQDTPVVSLSEAETARPVRADRTVSFHSAGEGVDQGGGDGTTAVTLTSGRDPRGNANVQDPPAVAPSEVDVTLPSDSERSGSTPSEDRRAGATAPAGGEWGEWGIGTPAGGPGTPTDRLPPATTFTGRMGSEQVAYLPAALAPRLVGGSGPGVEFPLHPGVDPRTRPPNAGYEAGAAAVPGGPLAQVPPRPGGPRSGPLPAPRAESAAGDSTRTPGWADLLDGASPFDWSNLEQDLRQFLGGYRDPEAGWGPPDGEAGWWLGLGALAASIAAREAIRRHARRLALWEGAAPTGRFLVPSGPWPLGPL